MQQTYLLCCPCHFGLERTLRFEISKIGGTDIAAQDGRVLFRGDTETIAKANLCLSTAERVLIQLGQFKAFNFEELFQGVRALPLEQWIGKDDAFPVKGHALDSKLHSVPDCQSIIKKAAVERLIITPTGSQNPVRRIHCSLPSEKTLPPSTWTPPASDCTSVAIERTPTLPLSRRRLRQVLLTWLVSTRTALSATRSAAAVLF